ncbi:uncharacterized protein Tco025E_05516 [Trypanosoma conorhini]|uniref:Uncharacterized protein n=1 Tax=Trypanosoma conorhini TaxID=83891 RepID=A0A3R7NA46_9TRYP|nr:uncharacterized protein Tco025E_05516 [Trypanosoma conorhini]RNF15496.1 hypothetical protein Tco025E_05516 [Trypanosoma conorhini]
MAVERDLATTVKNCTASLQELRDEVVAWEKKQRAFERQVRAAESACKSGVAATPPQREGDGGSSNATEAGNEPAESFFDAAKRKTLLLGKEHRQLQATNKALKKRLEASMSDYRSVRELKHAYRDLEVRKAEVARVNEKLRAANRWMKQCTWEGDERAVVDSDGGVA